MQEICKFWTVLHHSCCDCTISIIIIREI